MTNIDFDIFAHLRRENERLGRRLEVLEGGCGYGIVLIDLKRGFKPNDSKYITVPKNTLGTLWRNGIEGLGNKIRTTGVTLNLSHVEFNLGMSEKEWQIDELILAPLEDYPFNIKYDFVFDFTGPAFYFTKTAIPVYGRILQRGGFALMRIPFYVEPIRDRRVNYCSLSCEEGRKNKIGNLDRFLAENGMERIKDDVNVQELGPANHDAVFLVRKV